MKKTKMEKGITLVALIITIIVLLILAVVSIRAVQGDGIIQHAKNAKDEYAKAEENEQSILKNFEQYLEGETIALTDIYAKVYEEADGNKTLTFSKNNENVDGKTLFAEYDNIKGIEYIKSDGNANTPWYDIRADITKVEFLTEIVPISTANWFCGFNNLSTITNISNLNTSKVTNMSCMFSQCSSLTSLDVSKFNTVMSTCMDGMFAGCSSLTTLDLSNFDTSRVVTINSMFSSCESLTELNLSKFDTSNMDRMNSVFYKCTSLTELNLSNFDTKNVKDFAGMFRMVYCIKRFECFRMGYK